MRAAVGVLVALLLLLPAAAARAETAAPPDPERSSDQPALAITAPADRLTFPEANLNGSVITDGRVITLKADLFFGYNRADLTVKGAAELDRVASWLQRLSSSRILVAGHTDNRGSGWFNRGLAKRRAAAVRAELATRLPGPQIQVKAYGEGRPVATNETIRGRALNRRVTITVAG